MIVNGFPPSTVLTAAAIAALIIAVLYLLRVRRRQITVPYLGLWKQILETSEKKRKYRDWLKRLLSFLICLAVLGLLATALIDPRQQDDHSAQNHIIIIMDASASMKADATSAQKNACTSRFECAQKDALEIIEKMTPRDRAVIIRAAGIVGTVSGPFSADKDALTKTLKQISALDVSTDLTKAFELADHLSKNRKNPRIYLFSDGQFSSEIQDFVPKNIPFKPYTYGEQTGNLAIDSFNVRRYIANRLSFEVFVRVSNTFDVPVTAQLQIYNLDDSDATFSPNKPHAIISEKRITIPSGGSELRLYNNLPLGSGKMAAFLTIIDPQNLTDPLQSDNIAYARIPDFAKPNILTVTPGNLYLEAALLMNENYRVAFAKPSELTIKNALGAVDLPNLSKQYDIVILDNSYQNLGAVDTNDWLGNAIFINPEKSYAPWASVDVKNPLIERVNSKHPVSRWLSLRNLNLTSASVFKNVSNDDLVLRAIEGPLIAAKKTQNQRFVAIGFSLVQSDLIFRAALPILFINAIDWLMDENTTPERGYPTGSAWHIRVPDAFSAVSIAAPHGNTIDGLPVYEHSVSFYGDTAGFYKLTDATSTQTIEIAANFNLPQESNLNQKQTELSAYVPFPEEDTDANQNDDYVVASLLNHLPSSLQYIWILALIGAFVILAVEWLTYHKRWTV